MFVPCLTQRTLLTPLASTMSANHEQCSQITTVSSTQRGADFVKPRGGNITITFIWSRLYSCQVPCAVPGPPGKEGVSQELGGGQPENRTNLGFLGTAGLLFSSGLDALVREQWKDEGKGEAVLWLCLGLKMCSLAEKALVIHYQSLHGSETILLHVSQSLFCSSCR